LTQTISNEEHIEKIIDDIIRLVLIWRRSGLITNPLPRKERKR
jgi:hypothetical protein